LLLPKQFPAQHSRALSQSDPLRALLRNRNAAPSAFKKIPQAPERKFRLFSAKIASIRATRFGDAASNGCNVAPTALNEVKIIEAQSRRIHSPLTAASPGLKSHME
jgi:hypothetical protein